MLLFKSYTTFHNPPIYTVGWHFFPTYKWPSCIYHISLMDIPCCKRDWVQSNVIAQNCSTVRLIGRNNVQWLSILVVVLKCIPAACWVERNEGLPSCTHALQFRSFRNGNKRHTQFLKWCTHHRCKISWISTLRRSVYRIEAPPYYEWLLG